MNEGEIALSDAEFEAIKARILSYAGISLSDAKRTLVISRLSKLVRRAGLESFAKYVDLLDHGATAAQKQEFVNALTTNLTRFYREDHHFDHLVDYVGEIIRKPRQVAGKPRLRIWSAGCSTGQEPYTIGMALLARYPQLKSWDFRILATDVDTAVLAQAARGTYPGSEANGLSADRLKQLERDEAGQVHIPAAVRNLVAFKPLNLMQDWPFKGPFEAIFCRNVAIYFDRPTQHHLFARLGDMLVDGGYLYIGHSENIPAGTGGFTLKGKTIYQHFNRAMARAS
ncbi:MAG: protein-glutamate O-methyltransferase CheR [Hyphomicrobiaceae bacterium]|nr:protein-glutamate O-methyltransferase CheR [Hyphomicrobiaceae bacterium]